MDSTIIVNFLTQHIGSSFAQVVYALIVVVIPILYRILITWANNRPTTWYWNSVTKMFVLKKTDAFICKMFGRGVKDCNARYEDNLPDEAKEELKKHLVKKYPTLQIEIPSKNKPS